MLVPASAAEKNWAALPMLLLAVLLTHGCSGPESPSPARREIVVAAASYLEYAFEEIGRSFEQETGIQPVFNFGSSGQLAQQVEAGVPVDVFVSANRQYVDDLDKKGLIEPGTNTTYARGRITIWTRADSPLQPTELADLAGAGIKRIAIANPLHAPYGVAAREALKSAGVWEQVEGRLLLASNIREALRHAEIGSVDAAIVALSLSIRGDGRYVTIPETMHSPIDQALGVIKASDRKDEALAFASYVTSEKAKPVLIKYGFEIR
ncbi:MAG TPA: molybdate ABC transporter substrate-binding protein [Thermoanaerobaculia bacterium]|nr:molybdate ABC transporter substrate-binding protein [Thermoanaerobaculia bacterium]